MMRQFWRWINRRRIERALETREALREAKQLYQTQLAEARRRKKRGAAEALEKISRCQVALLIIEDRIARMGGRLK